MAHFGADPLRAPHRINPRPRYRAMERHFVFTGRADAGAVRTHEFDHRHVAALRQHPSDQVTRQSIDIMRRELARISGQITDLTTTRDDLAYLIDTAAAFHLGQLATAT